MRDLVKNHWSKQPNREEIIERMRQAKLKNPSPTQFKPGHKPTKDTLDKLWAGRTKYFETVKDTPEYKAQRHEATRGLLKEGNPNWKGGISKSFKEGNRLKNSTWKQIRKTMLEENPECTECGADEKLVVHHIVDWQITKDDSLENLTVLCRACHINVHRPALIAGMA